MMRTGVHAGGLEERPLPGDAALRAREERLEALNATIGKLAHDFNNILAPTLGYLTLIKEEVGAESGATHYLAALETAARRGAGQIENVLLAVRPNRRFSPRELDLAEVVKKLVEEWKGELAPGSAIELATDLEECRVVADEQQWIRAINHLLGNARHALALGGKLEVSLRREVVTEAEGLQLGLRGSAYWKLIFRDSGFGMEEAVARRAFEPFFTTRTQVKAGGLGLAVVHGVALVHGGQVTLESRENEGTRITIYLPASTSGLTELPPAAGRAKGKSPAGGKVLLLEGEPWAREVLRGWLQTEGLEVYQAAGDAEFRKIFERHLGKWALLVLDCTGTPSPLVHEGLGTGAAKTPWILIGEKDCIPSQTGNGSLIPPVVLQKPVSCAHFREAVRQQLGPKEF